MAIVTGGSRGIGAAISKALAADGYSVVVNFLDNAGAANKVVREIEALGGNAYAVQGDLSQEDDVVRMFQLADRYPGALAVLVNNGGITGGFPRVDEISKSTLDRVFGVNVIGAFFCSQEAVKRMSTSHGGHGGSIINISSRAGQLGGSGEWVHYAATKGAIDSLTVGLAREVAREGIRVNAVAPGLIDTELHATAGKPQRAADLALTIPMGRPGTADEVAESVRWLASPAAAYVPAAILGVSGGR